jgi:hypothetical protein
MVDTATGNPDLGPGSWTVDCQCAGQTTAAFGLAVQVVDGVAYLGAGGNDWAGAFSVDGTVCPPSQVAPCTPGTRLWQTDANGSVQDLTVYDSSSVIIGGHYTSIEVSGEGDPSGSECPERQVKDQSPCMLQPRLAAVSRDTGLAIQTWRPKVCCLYRGVWATLVDGTTLHVGGEFNQLDTDAAPENYYGRFLAAP